MVENARLNKFENGWLAYVRFKKKKIIKYLKMLLEPFVANIDLISRSFAQNYREPKSKKVLKNDLFLVLPPLPAESIKKKKKKTMGNAAVKDALTFFVKCNMNRAKTCSNLGRTNDEYNYLKSHGGTSQYLELVNNNGGKYVKMSYVGHRTTKKKKKIPIRDFFSECDQIRTIMRI